MRIFISNCFIYLLIMSNICGCSYYPTLRTTEVKPSIIRTHKQFKFPASHKLIPAVVAGKRGYFYPSYHIKGDNTSYRVPSSGNMLFDTGVHIDEGDIFTIISTHFEPVMIAVGENSKTMVPATYFIRAECSGELRLGIMQVHAAVDYGSKINMDIFVWEKEDYIQINNYLVKLKELNPKNKQINYILDEVAVYLDRKANNLRRDAERKAHDY